MQRQRERERKKIELWARSTLYCHFFAVVLHDYNKRLPSYTFYGGNVIHCMCSCLLFSSLPLIFILVAVSMSHILTAAIIFSCLSSNKTRRSLFVFVFVFLLLLFLPLALSLLSTSVGTSKFSRLTTVNLTSREQEGILHAHA